VVQGEVGALWSEMASAVEGRWFVSELQGSKEGRLMWGVRRKQERRWALPWRHRDKET
jgi:hypothetical protein